MLHNQNNNRIMKRVMYMKGRRSCNQPCHFSDCNKLELHEVGDKTLGCDHIVKAQRDQMLQISPVVALSTANTDHCVSVGKSVYHVEGGWPKDVNCSDSEQVARHRKKIERDEMYSKQVMELCRRLEHVVLQNNAVNIYQSFFTDAEPLPVAEKCFAKTTNTFKDPTGERVNRK